MTAEVIPTRRIRLKQPLLLTVPALLLLLYALAPTGPWGGLLVGAVLFLLLGFSWGFPHLYALHLSREMLYRRVQVGDVLQERYVLTNEHSVTAWWIEVIDHSIFHGGNVSIYVRMPGSLRNRWSVDSVCLRRGLFALGPTEIRSGDPFGLFEISISYPSSYSIVVTPRAVSSAKLTDLGLGQDYMQRDSWVLLDMDASVQVGEGQRATKEQGLILAASLVEQGIKAGRAVGLVAFGEDRLWFPPKESAHQREAIFRSLALLAPGEVPLASAIARLRHSLQASINLFLVTSSLDPSWLDTLPDLKQQEINVKVLLLEPRSYGAEGDSAAIFATLNDLGLPVTLIRAEMLDRLDVQPAPRREIRVTPLGRALPDETLSGIPWRKLT